MAVQRFENNVTLQVDSHIMRKQLPENSAALNVHFGTFLGGVGDFTAEFLNDVIGFRGCISDVSEECQRVLFQILSFYSPLFFRSSTTTLILLSAPRIVQVTPSARASPGTAAMSSKAEWRIASAF